MTIEVKSQDIIEIITTKKGVKVGQIDTLVDQITNSRYGQDAAVKLTVSTETGLDTIVIPAFMSPGSTTAQIPEERQIPDGTVDHYRLLSDSP